MQFSVTTWVTVRGAAGDTHSLIASIAHRPDLAQVGSAAPARSSGLVRSARRLSTGAAPASPQHVHAAPPRTNRCPARSLLHPPPGPPHARPVLPRPLHPLVRNTHNPDP